MIRAVYRSVARLRCSQSHALSGADVPSRRAGVTTVPGDRARLGRGAVQTRQSRDRRLTGHHKRPSHAGANAIGSARAERLSCQIDGGESQDGNSRPLGWT